MTHIRLKTRAVLVATTLASGAALAQTSPGTTTGSGFSSNEPTNPGTPGTNPGGTTTPPAVGGPAPLSPPINSGPSMSQGSTMGRGADDALATPDDRAKCAALSGTARADCISDARRHREADTDRLRTSQDTSQPAPRPLR